MGRLGRKFSRWKRLPWRRKIVAVLFGVAVGALLVWGLDWLGETLFEISMDNYGIDDVWNYEAGTEDVYKNGKLVLHVPFKIDEYGRRDTFQPNLKQDTDQYGIFLGCSFTFGHGVQSDETLASRVAARVPNYRIMNYGSCGSAPNVILRQITEPKFREGFAERKGFVVYTFIDDHLQRTVGAYEQVGDNNPYYRLTLDGGLAPVTNYDEWRPGARLMHTTVTQSGLAKFVNSGAPPEMTDEDFKLTARVIEEMAVVMTRDYGATHFVMLFYPNSYAYDRITPLLTGKGITMLDYNHMLDGTEEEKKNIVGHPPAGSYEKVAERLVGDLRAMGAVVDGP